MLASEPLSVEREHATDGLLTGKTDRETAEAVGVSRWTGQPWRTQPSRCMATVEQKRAEVWHGAQEKFRSRLSNAVENLGQAVESADLKASIERLKAVGMYGDETINVIFDHDPEKGIRQQAEAQVDPEGVPRNALRAMAENLETAAFAACWRRWKRRSAGRAPRCSGAHLEGRARGVCGAGRPP
jgi:hypothetical protein